MTGELGLALLLVPDTHGPIVRTSDEDWAVVRMPERVATHAVNWAHMAVVVVRVPLREGSGTFVDGAVLSGHEIVVASVVDGEVNGEATSVDEGHTSGLLIVDRSSIDVLLVRVRLTFQLLQIAVLKTLFHGPFNDTAVTGY